MGAQTGVELPDPTTFGYPLRFTGLSTRQKSTERHCMAGQNGRQVHILPRRMGISDRGTKQLGTPITRRPAARSSASTKPSKNTCGPCHQRRRSPHCNTNSTRSSPTTTGPSAPSSWAAHPDSGLQRPTQNLSHRLPDPHPTAACATTESTPPASSPSATTAACTTSAWASDAPSPKSPSSSTTAPSASSTATPANSSANLS